MTLQEFRETLQRDDPPPGVSVALAALWWDAKRDWKRAHETVADDEGPAAAWVHAYLHRKEGDASNAGYWYSRADRTPSQLSLQEEWAEITKELLR
jgi:hypothetical protein